ncbi:MAG: hypothetical protein JXA01_01305 [Dehalococcoidia bacterium]|nr:hypothetical protein [Dehalococcoidia bacterium]
MTNSDKQMGIVDPATGDIIFVSREEGNQYLAKSAQRLERNRTLEKENSERAAAGGPGVSIPHKISFPWNLKGTIKSALRRVIIWL